MYVHTWTCTHMHMPIPATLQTHSQWSAWCSSDIVGTAYLGFYRKKKTLLFEQISTENRYETEIQVTPSSLILLTVFLKMLACVEVIEKEKMKHLSMHKNSKN